MKKLLFFHHCGSVGGAGISGLCFLNSIPKDEYDITVYCVSKPDAMINKYRENGYNVIPGGDNPASYGHCVGDDYFALSPTAIRNAVSVVNSQKIVERIIREVKPDLVVANSMTLCWIGKLAKKYGAQTLCFFRETYVHGTLGLRTTIVKTQLSRYFDKVVFISNYELERSKEIKSEKKIIYNMVPQHDYDRHTREEVRKQLGLEEDTFYVLFVGGISRLKGTKVILDAFSHINDPQIKLLLVGGTMAQMCDKANAKSAKEKLMRLLHGDYKELCRKSIIENQLQDRICFYPIQSDISPFFRAADALVCPMTAPHQARPVFEAGYAKIPVVITDFENIHELVDDTSGYLFENENAQQLADLLTSIKNEYSQTRSRVENNYRNTVARHSPNVYKEQICRILKE